MAVLVVADRARGEEGGEKAAIAMPPNLPTLTQTPAPVCLRLCSPPQLSPPSPPAPPSPPPTPSFAAWSFGNDAQGQLGDSTLIKRAVPVAVVGGLAFTQIAAGGQHSCGLTLGGSAWCFGANNFGQTLSSGGATPYSSPVAAAVGYRFTQLSLGAAHSCGLTTAAGILCWGWNAAGELGTPNSLAGEEFVQVTAGGEHTCGLTTAGLAICFGAFLSSRVCLGEWHGDGGELGG